MDLWSFANVGEIIYPSSKKALLLDLLHAVPSPVQPLEQATRMIY